MYAITAGSRNPHSFRLQYQLKENFVHQPFCHEELFVGGLKECQESCNHCTAAQRIIAKQREFKWHGVRGNTKGKWKSFQNLTTTDDFWDWVHHIILQGESHIKE